MIYRNVHISGAEDQSATESGSTLPRLRFVKNDPAREYASRPGQVERLPDYVAALLLCKRGFAKVERHQITITVDGERMQFTSSDSITIATKNGTDERVLWVMNRLRPEVIHILTDDGAYVESIPRKGQPDWFAQDEVSREAMATAQRHLARDLSRLDDLHQPDAKAAMARTEHNAAEVQRLVNTFPAASAEEGHDEQSSFPKAEQLNRVGEALTRQQEKHRTRVDDERQLSEMADRAMGATAVTRQPTNTQPEVETYADEYFS